MDALNKLKSICEAATPGPWDKGSVFTALTAWRTFPGDVDMDTAAFIAAARTAIPALIELVEALEWERECREFYSENHYTYMPANYELLATMTAAFTAVKTAKAKLEAAL